MYIDGHYLSQGVDLYRLLCRLNATRAFNLIDAAVIDEAIRDGGLEDPRQKLKATINKLYDRIVVEGSSNDTDFADRSVSHTQPPVYLEPDESGYPGLMPPVG